MSEPPVFLDTDLPSPITEVVAQMTSNLEGNHYLWDCSNCRATSRSQPGTSKRLFSFVVGVPSNRLERTLNQANKFRIVLAAKRE